MHAPAGSPQITYEFIWFPQKNIYFIEVGPTGSLSCRPLWLLFCFRMWKFHALFPTLCRRDISSSLRALWLLFVLYCSQNPRNACSQSLRLPSHRPSLLLLLISHHHWQHPLKSFRCRIFTFVHMLSYPRPHPLIAVFFFSTGLFI